MIISSWLFNKGDSVAHLLLTLLCLGRSTVTDWVRFWSQVVPKSELLCLLLWSFSWFTSRLMENRSWKKEEKKKEKKREEEFISGQIYSTTIKIINQNAINQHTKLTCMPVWEDTNITLRSLGSCSPARALTNWKNAPSRCKRERMQNHDPTCTFTV